MIDRLRNWRQRTNKEIVHLSIKHYREVLDEIFTYNMDYTVPIEDPSITDLGFIKIGRMGALYY